MSRVYNFIFGKAVTDIVTDLFRKELLEDEFILYYEFFKFLTENRNAVSEKELKRLGNALSKARVKSNDPVIQEKISEFKDFSFKK